MTKLEKYKKIASIPILRTRLYKPRVKDNYVIRKHIIDLLEKNRHNPLTLVVAATGYGKSVTVSEWLDQTKTRHCWLSLDDEFNDMRTFFFYLIHAIRSVFPDALSHLHDLLHGPDIPPQNVLIRFLINGLDETDQEIIIVLDDYHLIHNNHIHEIMNSLLKNPLPHLHLVIISRRDPALNLSSLHTFGDIHELRMAALSFTQDEIIALAKSILNIRISEKLAASLLNKTEGWIVGLRMALLQMTMNNDIEDTLEGLKADQQYFHQYLLTEVLQQQPEPARKLLLTASMSDRFSRELLVYLSEKGNENADYPDPALFDQLISSNIFIIALDDEGKWYRFHHFFHDFLSKQFEKEHTKEDILSYHTKASLFQEQNHNYEQAIRHALKSEDNNRVVQIFEKYKHDLLNSDQFDRLSAWLRLMPAGMIEEQPELLLTRALLHELSADYQAMQSDLSLAESMLANMRADSSPGKQMWAEFHAINAALSYYTGNNEGALESSQIAIKNLSDQSAYLQIFTRAIEAFSLMSFGKSAEAVARLKKELSKLPSAHSADRARTLALLSIIYAYKGDLPELVDTALQYRSISLKNKLYVTHTMSNYFLSAAYYLRNELEKSRDLIDNIHFLYSGRPFWTLNLFFTKALCLQAEGKLAELESLMQEIRTFADDVEIQTLRWLLTAFEVELALRQNNTSAAWELSKNANFEVYPPVFYFYFSQLTYVRLLMVSDEPDKIREAEERLQQLVEIGYSTHKRILLNQALPLQAKLYQKTDNGEKALQILNKALALARPTGHIRNFLDLGAPMQAMIESLYQKQPDDAFLSKIVTAFKEEQLNLPSAPVPKGEVSAKSAVIGAEKITTREIQLLQLVAEGYQNKEIAEKLHLAPNTIKKSLYHIYQKINVNNRTSAVSTATMMGLIKPPVKPD